MWCKLKAGQAAVPPPPAKTRPNLDHRCGLRRLLYSIAHMLMGEGAHMVHFGVPTWGTGYALMLRRIVFGGGVIVQLAGHTTLHNVTQGCQCNFAFFDTSSFSLCTSLFG